MRNEIAPLELLEEFEYNASAINIIGIGLNLTLKLHFINFKGPHKYEYVGYIILITVIKRLG